MSMIQTCSMMLKSYGLNFSPSKSEAFKGLGDLFNRSVSTVLGKCHTANRYFAPVKEHPLTKCFFVFSAILVIGIAAHGIWGKQFKVDVNEKLKGFDPNKDLLKAIENHPEKIKEASESLKGNWNFLAIAIKINYKIVEHLPHLHDNWSFMTHFISVDYRIASYASKTIQNDVTFTTNFKAAQEYQSRSI